MSPGLLLDTCALLWLVQDDPVSSAARKALNAAQRSGSALGVSPISAWEVGILAARGRLAFSIEPKSWFNRIIAQPWAMLCDIAPETLIESSFLPGQPPRDPADRIILATARSKALPVMTRDRAILAYAEAGHVAAIPC